VKIRPELPPLELRLRGIVGPMRGLVERDIRELLAEPDDDRPQTECRKTRTERGIVLRAIAALNRFRPQMGLAPVLISEHQIHVLELEEFTRAFPEDTKSAGVSIVSHAYVLREPSPAIFTVRVTHELVHLSAFKRFLVEAMAERDEKDGKDVTVVDTVRELRSGVCRVRHVEFLGLNEAVTEIAASFVRQTMLERPHRFEPFEVETLKETCAYSPQIAVFTALLEELWEEDVTEGFAMAFWDAMTGTDDFLRHIKKVKPEAIEPLRKMDDTVESALKAALALGYDEAAKEIWEEDVS
jgi:hypothetical protein